GGDLVAALSQGRPPRRAAGGAGRHAARGRVLSVGGPWGWGVGGGRGGGLPPGQPRERVPRAGALRGDGSSLAALDRRRSRAGAPEPAPGPLALAGARPRP